MPVWRTAEREYDLPRKIAFLDTNVLVAYVNPKDPLHRHTVAALDMGEYEWAVAHCNILEAWNFLTGRDKRRDLAISMMTWLLTPGQVILVGDILDVVPSAHDYSVKFRVDLADANLLDLADRISRECGFEPAVHVATYDTSDFLRMFGGPNLSFNVYDMRDLSSTTAAI